MKTTHKVLASLGTLFAACLLHAADPKPALRVSSIVDIETEDPAAYAAQIAKYNEVAKARLGIDPYLRVYESRFDSRDTPRVRAVVSAASVAELSRNLHTLEADPEIVKLMDRMRSMRKMKSRTLLQGIYTDGLAPRGAHNYSVQLNITDEAAYVKALGELRKIFDEVGLQDAKITANRVLAGRTDHSHRVNISMPDADRLAAFLDASATNKRLLDWIASVAKIRTVVASWTAREITK